MSIQKPAPNSDVKIIVVAKCAKKTCRHNSDSKCRAVGNELGEMGCFIKFTGYKKPVKEEPLDRVFL